MYQGAKEKAAELGLDFAVCGNAIPLWPGAGLMRGAIDVATFEWLVDGAYPGFSDPGLPPELDRLINACLAKKQADRPASVDDLRRDLKPLRHRVAG